MSDLTEIIEDSISDAEMSVIEPETTADDIGVEGQEPEVASSEESTETPTETPEETPEETSTEVKSPGAKQEVKSPEADFEKKYGIPATSSSGRENRIPHSRVVKIVNKAVKDAIAEAKTGWEKESTPRIQEYESKVKDYEDRLVKVGEFERVMSQEPTRFVEMLYTLPQYQQLFDGMVQNAIASVQAQAQPTATGEISDDMPQPDQPLADGTMVYSMEGLRKLNEWNRTQARKETLSEVEKRFGPIEQEWQAHQKIQQVIPAVQKQIDEARTWPQFNESEKEIVEALQKNPNLSLEGAYRQVVYPKIATDRTKMRAEILAELKSAPRATSAPAAAAKSVSRTSGEPKSLEDVIRESIKDLK